VPILHKTNYGNQYYTDLFKSFIEGRHGELGALGGEKALGLLVKEGFSVRLIDQFNDAF
jgi:hypothetical protein